MQFINLKAQYNVLKDQIDAKYQQVMQHGFYIGGPELAEFEQQIAEYVGVKHAICCSSGTVAIQMAMMALNIQPGDEVITSPFSFFAAPEMMMLLGIKPVYVDIDPKTYNLDANLLEAQITDKTKAIMPVSMYGQPADMTAINAIAAKHGIPVVEDAAQSFGGTHHGKKSCGLSDIACTSFFPSKPLGTYGDGGACFTNDDNLAHILRQIMNHGQEGRYNHVRVGINGRMDTYKAAVLSVKLAVFDQELKQRQQVFQWYRAYLPEPFSAPHIAENNTSAVAQFTIRCRDRDAVVAKLKAQDIPTAVHYPVVLYKQPCVSEAEQALWHCAHAEKAADEVLSLPFGPYMSEDEVKQVCAALRS